MLQVNVLPGSIKCFFQFRNCDTSSEIGVYIRLTASGVPVDQRVPPVFAWQGSCIIYRVEHEIPQKYSHALQRPSELQPRRFIDTIGEDVVVLDINNQFVL